MLKHVWRKTAKSFGGNYSNVDGGFFEKKNSIQLNNCTMIYFD